jgi:hypothetical protein
MRLGAQKQGGWNTPVADLQLKDHTMREIARPNNDTFYSTALLDLRNDASLHFPPTAASTGSTS